MVKPQGTGSGESGYLTTLLSCGVFLKHSGTDDGFNATLNKQIGEPQGFLEGPKKMY